MRLLPADAIAVEPSHVVAVVNTAFNTWGNGGNRDARHPKNLANLLCDPNCLANIVRRLTLSLHARRAHPRQRQQFGGGYRGARDGRSGRDLAGLRLHGRCDHLFDFPYFIRSDDIYVTGSLVIWGRTPTRTTRATSMRAAPLMTPPV